MKLVKTAGTVAIASALLLTSSPPVWANEAAVGQASKIVMPVPGSAQVDPQITKEQAIAAAKKYIQIPDGYTLESVNLNSYMLRNGKNIPSWNLNFVKRVKDQYYGSINMTVNGLNGKLTGYSMNDNDPAHKPSYPPKADYKAAKEIAAAWILKMDLDAKEQLLYNNHDEQSFRTPLDGNYQYNIRYDRSVDGVAFPENGINITVNGEGQVTGYNYMWDDTITFEKNVKPISQDKAAQAFHDKANVSLAYMIPYQASEKKKPLITYTMDMLQLNAANGEPWSPGQLPVRSTGNTEPLTAQPLGEVPSASADLNLTKEQAIAKVSSSFAIPANAKLEDASYNEFTNPETDQVNSSWNLRWSLPKEENSAADASVKRMDYSIWATVNSKNGEIMNYNVNTGYDPTGQKPVNAKVSQEEAKSKAIEFVKKQFSGYTSQLVLDIIAEKDIQPELLKQMRNWDVHFKRVIDGVSAGYEGVNIGVDRETGEIVNFYNSISSLEYPSKKPDVLAIDKAKELLLSQYDIQLNYATVEKHNIPMPYDVKYKLMIAAGEIAPGTNPGASNEPTVAQLVYSLTPKYTREAIVLDAQTGDWRNAGTGEIVSLEKVKVDDIDGHWAQNELQLMLDYQALDVKDGKVNPDQSITRGEMIKMLVTAMNGGNGGIRYGAERKASFADVAAGSAYFAYVENAVDRGLLDPGADFKPEAKMNREEMAQLIVKALGYSSLTKYEGIFNDSFADKAKLKNVGEAAIVVGLDIMSLNDGSFQPEQEVTKAQAATAFFRYLQKRAEIQDRQHRVY
ncbi:S-layer homology domain-containing protein [Paenibacillus rigui]|uniref:SLH domain-containing protein n=1 Tax=Paenibacillus rigui TaxID=554312 RepID=A0A229ULQ0_9BACL|nr:S-layer homology domain-containing protein [Paenibacillus rigui]OXM84303.1 hypothetical protein CF651_21200 [Paenibacillus rigui]